MKAIAPTALMVICLGDPALAVGSGPRDAAHELLTPGESTPGRLRAECHRVDRGDPLDGITSITETTEPLECPDVEPWEGWHKSTWESNANDNDVTYVADIRWNRGGLPCDATMLWLRGSSCTEFHRDFALAREAQDFFSDQYSVRSIEVRFTGVGIKAFPQNGFPNISAVIADIWEHAVWIGLAEGRRIHVGSSSGAMQAANALAYHSLEEMIDGALFGGGPFWSNLESTCTDQGSPLYAPLNVRQMVDGWSYQDLHGTSPCADNSPSPEPAWECFSTLGSEADLEHPTLQLAVVVGTDDAYGPWISNAAMDYFQNVTAATKTFDQPGAPHTIWESEAGSALAVTRLEQILGTSVDVAVNTMREANPLIIAPNPMTTHTWARFSVSETGNVSLRVYDVAGRQVTDLVDGILGEGPHEVRLARGALPGGVYFLRLVSSDGLSVGKVSVLR